MPERAPARAQGRRRVAGLAGAGAGRQLRSATHGVARAALCHATSRVPAGFQPGSRVASFCFVRGSQVKCLKHTL